MSEILQSLLLAVEQQLQSAQTPYVKKTYDRLLALGLSADAAREEIADCLGEEMDAILAEKRAFSEKNYRTLLDRLPWNETPDQGNDLQNLSI